MSMPPAGVVGGMDQDAVIQAEIEWELDNINLEDGLDDVEDVADEEEEEVLEEGMPDELDNYIKRLQEQTSNFERELEECDELITHTDRPRHNGTSDAVIPYEDFSLLSQLAKESGCDIDQYKQKILLELEQDDDILHDDLADLLTDDNGELGSGDHGDGQGHDSGDKLAEGGSGVVSAITEKEATVHTGDPSLPVAIERAVEQGVDPAEVPVSQDLVPLNNRAGIQQMLREQLTRLENTYRERTERIKQEEALKREKEESRQKLLEDERQQKKEEIKRQEQKLKEGREVAETQIKKEEEEAEQQMAKQMKKFKDEMRVLEAETERQKAELAKARMDEEIRQIDRQHHSALLIQRSYKGYRTRKQYLPVLEEKREERRKLKEECRIREIEKEIEETENKKRDEEEQKRLKLEEEKRRKEEEKQRKEEEKRLKEEEKRKKKEEEERKKAEEKKRKEEEKQRLEEEKRRKKEEEKRKKEAEAERKREEKRLREEEEKRRKEEEKVKKEEEKRKKEEEKQLKEQEKKRKEEEQKLKAEDNIKDEGMLKEKETKMKESEELKCAEQDLSVEKAKKDNFKESQKVIGQEIDKENGNMLQIDEKLRAKQETEVGDSSPSKLSNGTHDSDSVKESKQNKVEKEKEQTNPMSKSGKLGEIIENVNRIENNLTARAKLGEVKEAKSPRIPHPPSSPKKKQPELTKDLQKSIKKSEADKSPSQPADCLPEHLEARRIAFIKDCLPWSKISNEPWKLKGVTSKKPLRRPSSAKKLSPLPEDIIVKAARVASLKQVTTVELCDLPGYSMSPLGQCWGLKYLSMVRCNLRLTEGLQQCKQLLYINVQENKIEYIDLKDVGSLQVLDMSHNCLSSIHGLDNCTNLRWLDVSHNNITRLGGLETLRRLHTLKLSHNQLISTAGLGDTPTIQVLDVSANHLQRMDDIEKLCLLLSLDVSANNILKAPSLKNQVLLHELLLTDNSITSLCELSRSWLPVLYKVAVAQNSIVEPESMQNCLTLRDLDISSNQILDAEMLKKCIENCLYLEQLNLEENPFVEEMDNSFYDQLHKLLPRLQKVGSDRKHIADKPRCSFEAMCLSQAQVYTEMFSQLEQNIRNHDEKSSDLAHKCDSYFKFCDKTFQIAVEHRYAHEYGEVSVSIPTAPITPRSGRPNSARKIVPKGEVFTNPKDLFEKALQSSDKTSAVVNSPGVLTTVSANKKANPVVTSASAYSNPKDLFEQALKSSTTNINSSNCGLVNGVPSVNTHSKSSNNQSAAAVKIQAAWRGWSVRHEISQQTKIWLAAITIQSAWRGYRVRKWYRALLEEKRNIENIDPVLVEKLHRAATTIQAAWRGYWLRSKLLAALEYARFEDDDDDAMNLNGEEFDIDKFMDFNEDLLDNDWRPPSTPEIPSNHPVLRKPPSGRPKIPPISTGDRPPSNPRRAWKNLESPMSDIQNPLGRIPRPPSSVSSGANTQRTAMSKKEEKLSEEWGFKDSSTAHLMMQRAKKMKYNAERKKKIGKLDPKQRLRLFQKLQEEAHINQHVHVPQRKTLPRKEYFQARQDEMVRKEREKHEEYNTRASRIYEWLHMPVNNYPVTDSIINKGINQGHRFASESNLPDVQMGKRVQLTSGPGSLELQSVDSMSNAGDQRRRFSAGSGSSVINKLPPIQTTSAPTAKTKERMSWRNPKVNQSVGWGGGKKRGNVH